MPLYPPAVPVTVLVVRHAPTVWNDAGRWQGQADPPLSPAGVAMARDASERLGPVDLVVTSGLGRAVDTARLLAPGPPMTVVEGLAEHDVGEWSGLTRDQIRRRWPGVLEAFDGGRRPVPPGGESFADFERRVAAATGRALAAVAGSAARRVLMVTHAGVIRALCRLDGTPERHVDHLCGFECSGQSDSLSIGPPICLSGPVRAGPERDRPGAL